LYVLFCFFFFSSRRRHTRCLSDWSSDVCSSDLFKSSNPSQPPQIIISVPVQIAVCDWRGAGAFVVLVVAQSFVPGSYLPPVFNEIGKRRVGKECRSRWWPDNEQKRNSKTDTGE